MSFPTYAVSTELDAVNQILSSVGQAPVTTLDKQNPEVAIVLNTLREVNKMVQAEGWAFNTETDYELVPDSNSKEIAYASNWLQVDPIENVDNINIDAIRRNGKLYDKKHHTYEFTKNIKVNITWLFDFSDVPPQVQQYITARAARMCATKMIGDREINALLQEQEQLTRAMAMNYETEQGDYSFFGFENGKEHYNGFIPADALRR